MLRWYLFLRENKGMTALRTVSGGVRDKVVEWVRGLCMAWPHAVAKTKQKLDSGSAFLSHNHLSNIQESRM